MAKWLAFPSCWEVWTSLSMPVTDASQERRADVLSLYMDVKGREDREVRRGRLLYEPRAHAS